MRIACGLLLVVVAAAGIAGPAAAQTTPFSVVRIDSSNIAVAPIDILWLLAGRVPTALVAGEGRPGISPAIRLRGALGPPLVVLDGLVLEHTTAHLNPSDIAQVEVLSGLAGSAAWGVRGTNGVILLTSRRPLAAGPRFRLRSEVARSDMEGSFNFASATSLRMDERGQRFCIVDAAQAQCARSVDWRAELARINGVPGDSVGARPGLLADPGAGLSGRQVTNLYQATPFPGPVFDQARRAISPGPLHHASLDYAERFGQVSVDAGVSQLGEPGMLTTTADRSRLNGRVALRWAATPRLSMTVHGSASRGTSDDTFGQNTFFLLTRQSPMAEILASDSLGRRYAISDLQASNYENPIAEMELIQGALKTNRVDLGARLEYDLTSWLRIEGRLAHTSDDFTQNTAFARSRQCFGQCLPSVNYQTGEGRSSEYAVRLAASRSPLEGLVARASIELARFSVSDEIREGSGLVGSLPGVPTLNNGVSGLAITMTRWSSEHTDLALATSLAYRERYFVDVVLRRDALSGAVDNTGSTRLGIAWLPSRDFGVRLSRGSVDRVEIPQQLFPVLGPPIAVPLHAGGSETEAGIDVGVLRPLRLSATVSSGRRDFIADIPLPAERGFGYIRASAGDLDVQAFELSARLQVLDRPSTSWSVQFGYGRVRTTVNGLTVPPFNFGTGGPIFLASNGGRYGDFYGRRFIRGCAELPAGFSSAATCGGVDTEFQINDDGYVVWVGQGNSWRDGIRRNLFGTFATTGTPWGVRMDWGMPIILRDSLCVSAPDSRCAAQQVVLGNALPDWQFSAATSFRWKRFSVAAMLHGVMGREVWNQGRHWSYFNGLNGELDQYDKPVDRAKPVGYYWRAGATDGFSGVGGLYDILGPNSHFTESTNFIKLRELAVSYTIGSLLGRGDWTVTLTGRNLFTLSDYHGIDPEVPFVSAAQDMNGIDTFQMPMARTVGMSLTARF